MFFCGEKRGETVRERDGRQREGKTEPKGRGEQGGRADSNETPIKA